MKLSQLVDFRNKLSKMPVAEAEQHANQKLDHLNFHVGSIYEFIPDDLQKNLETSKNNIHQAYDNYDQSIEQLKIHVQAEIDKQENHWFQESYKLFETGMSLETDQDILNRRLSITGENTKHSTYQSELTLRARLSSLSDWRFPGLIIRPGLENFIESMVGYDPLYIVDQNYNLLNPCMEHFPKMYQNRLRPYLLNDRTDDPILGKIPDGQFGLCLVYNFFNYRPFEVIRRYLEEIYVKLKPGGILLMTYNDCDQSNAVELVERYYACYTPGYLVRDLAKAVGFDQTHTWGDDGPSVWLELRKPGELASLRGGQTIATIQDPQMIEEDVDFLKRKVYNINEVERMRTEAKRLGIPDHEYMHLAPFDLQIFVANQKADKIREQIAREQSAEEQRIKELHNRAIENGVDPLSCNTESEIHQKIAESIDTRKKRELMLLRQRALELNAGDINLIKYGYSAEKLKQLIKQKEEENK